MKRLLICAAAALLAGSLVGCKSLAESTTPTSNPNVKAEVLFTDADGYTVKRFYDGYAVHYYATPGPASTFGRIKNGKNSSRPVSVPTLPSEP